MSTTRTIAADTTDARASAELVVTRFSMGERGTGLHLSIYDRYVHLTPEQRLELYAVLGELFGTPPPVVRHVSEYAEAHRAHREVLDVLEHLERDPGTHPLTTDDATTLVRAYQQAKQLYTRIGKVMMGDPPPEPTMAIMRDEVIAELRADPMGDELRERLIERLAITEAELTNWMTVTLSRDAVQYLTIAHSGPRTALDERTAALANEVTTALANAKPEEDE